MTEPPEPRSPVPDEPDRSLQPTGSTKPDGRADSTGSAPLDESSETRSGNPLLSMGKFQSDQTSANVLAYLISGPATFAGLGWLLDQWLGTGFLVLIGMLGGMAMSLYVIWLRYGTQ